MSEDTMQPTLTRVAASLASIVGLRMFGLFLILPVFAVYGQGLGGATPTLIGLAIGIYGLTQALLQVPLGMLSDRVGRRKVIFGGLLLFLLGSVVAALSDHILGVILGRALQGAGAISAVVMALAADLTPPERRTRIMAAIGMSVGLAFMLALVLGPVIASAFGLSGLFWITAALTLLAMASLALFVPSAPDRPAETASPRLSALLLVLRDRDLMRLNVSVGMLHFVLTGSFLVVPLILADDMGLAVARHWQIYVPVLLLSVLLLVPAVGYGERTGNQRMVLAFGMGLMLLALTAQATGLPGFYFLVALWLYFSAFNILEASLPSLVSRYASTSQRGAALGVYGSAQFGGAFLGGVLGGLTLSGFGVTGVFLLCALAAVGGLLATLGLGRCPTGEACESSMT
ncbi:MAG: MFS transporter [Ectothiorhodospiraceae bacterium]|nr:MFS transporter [Ectothiorhodospiraceae bacterium]